MRVREVGTQLIDSESQAEVSPKTDENQGKYTQVHEEKSLKGLFLNPRE